MFEKVLVAIFTYNEEKNISSLLKEVSKKFKNIIVVDNNSEDDTFLILYRKKILDIQCGLRAFNTRDKKIDWSSTGLMHYFADAEITCNAIKNKCNINQIPIKTIISENYKGMNVLQGLFLVIMVFYWRIF